MVKTNLPQIVPLAQQLTFHLQNMHALNAKALDETERARKTLVEIMTVYDHWKIKLELEGQ